MLPKGSAPKRRRKRNRRDKLLISIRYLGLAGWLMLFSSIVIFYAAKPDYYWDRQQKMANPNKWDLGLLQYYLCFMVICFVISLVGIILSKNRMKRRTDSYNVNLIILSVI